MEFIYFIMAKTKITRNYQITLPKEIREHLKLEIGENLQIHLDQNKIILERSDDDVWEECAGFLPENFEEIMELYHTDQTTRFKKLGLF